MSTVTAPPPPAHRLSLCSIPFGPSAALQVIIQKLSEQDGTKAAVLQYGDQVMEALLRVMSSRR